MSVDPKRVILLEEGLQDHGVLVLSECRPNVCNATERRATRPWCFGTDAGQTTGGSVLEGVPRLSYVLQKLNCRVSVMLPSGRFSIVTMWLIARCAALSAN